MAIVSVSKIGIYEIRATNGDTRLGGTNFDWLLVKYCLEDLHKDCLYLDNNPVDMQRLKKACEKAKKKLSTEVETKVVVDWIENECFEVAITRTCFEQMIAHYIQTTMDCVESALKDADMDKSEIDDIILVGGSTYMPIVRSSLETMFNKEMNTSINPHKAGNLQKLYMQIEI